MKPLNSFYLLRAVGLLGALFLGLLPLLLLPLDLIESVLSLLLLDGVVESVGGRVKELFHDGWLATAGNVHWGRVDGCRWSYMNSFMSNQDKQENWSISGVLWVLQKGHIRPSVQISLNTTRESQKSYLYPGKFGFMSNFPLSKSEQKLAEFWDKNSFVCVLSSVTETLSSVKRRWKLTFKPLIHISSLQNVSIYAIQHVRWCHSNIFYFWK